MDEVIEAFQIFKRYGAGKHDVYAEHDQVSICVSPEKVSPEDMARLSELRWFIDETGEGFCMNC